MCKQNELLKDSIGRLDTRVEGLNNSVLDSLSDYDRLTKNIEGVRKFGSRIDFIEDEMRQVRGLTEDCIKEANEKLQSTITQKDCEETIFKFNYDLWKNVLSNLVENGVMQNFEGIELKRNHNYTDQLKLDTALYNRKLMQRMEKTRKSGKVTSKTFDGKLKTSGRLRTEWLLVSLDARNLNEKPKLDDYGNLRSNSVTVDMRRKTFMSNKEMWQEKRERDEAEREGQSN